MTTYGGPVNVGGGALDVGAVDDGRRHLSELEELEKAVERLSTQREALQKKLSKHKDALRRRDSPLQEGAVAGSAERLAAADLPLRPGDLLTPFTFPQADLPWPLAFLRIVRPGGSQERPACGDWLSLFRNAAPYIAAFRGGVAVVHVPSWVLENKVAFRGLMEDVAFCSLLGIGCVVVTSIEDRVMHRLQELGYKERPGSSIVGNRLEGIVFDERALMIAKQEAGLARVEVESALSAGFEKRATRTDGGSANGTSAGIFPVRGAVSVVSSTSCYSASPMGVREGVDYGYAGRVRSVNTEMITRCLADGDIVSLSPLGASPSGEVFFVSSEELAAIVAKKLKAIKLVYFTEGEQLVDTRDGHIMAGLQLCDAKALLKRLSTDGGLSGYSQEERESSWFRASLRQLRWLCEAVDPKGVRRGHLVDAQPGALLQEFYTTDGSGTVIAQDSYQGLGRAEFGDAAAIRELLADYAKSRGLNPRKAKESVPSLTAIEVGCASGEFFAWKRDEVVLGCGQLLPLATAAAELRCLAVAEGQQETHTVALLSYAEQVAQGAGATYLAVQMLDPDHVSWFSSHGFHRATSEEEAGLPAGRALLLKHLDEGTRSEAAAAIARLTEDERMWGGTQP